MLGSLVEGCASTSWEYVRDSEDVDELHSYILDNRGTLWADQARQRIEMLEHRAAVREGTRYAYNLFLERHPDSVYAHQIRRRLEELEYAEVQADPDPDKLLRFLQDWPRGRLAGRVRAMLEQAWCRHWSEADDPAALSTFLDLHPAISCRSHLVQRHQELLFNAAVASEGTSGLIRFLHAYPTSGMSQRVRTLLAERLSVAYLRATLFEQAERIIKEYADSASYPGLQERVATARHAWIRASFDPPIIRASIADLVDRLGPERAERLHRWADRLEARPARYRPLAEATAVLRDAARPDPRPAASPSDPRERWLLADRLARLANERNADRLLSMLGDPFLEVRRRAWYGLGTLVESLGPVRADAWIARNREKLRVKARSGILLLRLAVLCRLAGERERALEHIEIMLQSAEEPDLFAHFLAVDLCVHLGKDIQAATLALQLVRRAQAFAEQRTSAWRGGGAGLRNDPSGWISLRQLHGLVRLWGESLAHFQPAPVGGHLQVSPVEGLLGPWVADARNALGKLATWLTEEEQTWARKNPGYVPSDRPAAAGDDDGLVERAHLAVGRLVLSGLPEASVTVNWTRCCHPRPSLRKVARRWTLAIDWAFIAASVAATAAGCCCPPIAAYHHEKTCQPG